MIGFIPEDGPAAGKLQEFKQFIKTQEQKEESKLVSIIEALFSRAPLSYLQKISLERMHRIGNNSLSLLEDFCSSNDIFRVKVSSSQDEQRSIIRTAISDRPFVVDSVTELLKSLNIKRQILLNPIIEDSRKGLVSTTYVEVNKLSNDEVLKLEKELKKLFKSLYLATEDYKSMLAVAKDASLEVNQKDPRGNEVSEFINWLTDRGFVFLGYKSISTENENDTLGLFKDIESKLSNINEEVLRDVDYISKNKNMLHYAKLPIRSSVHKRAFLDAIFIKPELDQQKLHCFVGLFTTRSTTKEALAIPIVREKLKEIINQEGLRKNTHDYKELLSVANNFPKSDLLQFPTSRLRQEFYLIADANRRSVVRAGSFIDPLSRFTEIKIAIPSEYFSSETKKAIKKYLTAITDSKARSIEEHVASFNYSVTLLTFHIPNADYLEKDIDLELLENTVTELSSSWKDQLQKSLVSDKEEKDALALFNKYRKAFPGQYRALNDSKQALEDINKLEELSDENPFEISISEEQQGIYGLKIFKMGKSLALSSLLPFLKNLGVSIERETVTKLTFQDNEIACIYKFDVTTQSGDPLESKNLGQTSIENLKLILQEKSANDILNQLIFSSGLDCADIAILRSLAEYLWQLKASTSKIAALEALCLYPEAAKLLVEFFKNKFDPQLHKNQKNRDTETAKIKSSFLSQLKKVKSISQDKMLRALLNILESCVRTNFYQHPDELRIALKIDCSKITTMPNPRPVYETFVSSPEVQGVHLRGGMVARGGLRWSDREDDFRTEVLGLMKTQMVKNSIIVPTGAKGGFVVKNRPQDNKELRESVEQCYRSFIRSLLELADNRKDGEVIRPPATICYDDIDPYLVVAADRGTATFSDIANEIAEKEFSFWLGDAFASGGSFGYDHKKYGITAKGAWECVKRHFREIGVDIQTEEFTSVGIGDMSGDVFGNGMLLSEKLRLVAAFNHRHIFIDPNPKTEESFKERSRMFLLPHSSWTDYDQKLISDGGGIFDRSDKEINLTKEAAKALGTEPGTYSGDALIKIILKAPVDLLWNGGIGTYVKSYSEINSLVGDPSNDEVRVDARDLRARVIGEGGNLGFTQKGRIEYSSIGGRMNTDAVDNSGGVDLSDLEVNLKILFRQAQARGELSLEERNSVLEQCANEACEKVLSHNKKQSELISLAVRRSRSNVRYYRNLLDRLEKEGLLDREGESLPDDETLKKRSEMKAGLSRPELAVVTAYTKMSLYETLINSTIPEESFVERYLIDYFPSSITKRFKEDILSHPLRREIISTFIANLFVQRMGASFISRFAEETGARRKDIVYAFLAAENVLEIDRRSKDISAIDIPGKTKDHLKLLIEVHSVLESTSRWMLNRKSSKPNLESLISTYRDNFAELVRKAPSFSHETELSKIKEKTANLKQIGLNDSLSEETAAFLNSLMYLYVVELSEQIDSEMIDIAHFFSRLTAALQSKKLLEKIAEIETNDKWDALSIRAAHADVKLTIAKLAKQVIETNGDTSIDKMDQYLEDRNEILDCYAHSMQEFDKGNASIPAFFVVIKQLQALWR